MYVRVCLDVLAHDVMDLVEIVVHLLHIIRGAWVYIFRTDLTEIRDSACST
jgi:hypothetical protein